MNRELPPAMAHLVKSLARDALRGARAGQSPDWRALRWSAVADLVGPAGAELMLNHWCDAMITAWDSAHPGRVPRPPLVLTHADQLDPPRRWAMRYLVARWAGDADMAADLVASATSTQLAQGADELLELAAAWVDNYERAA